MKKLFLFATLPTAFLQLFVLAAAPVHAQTSQNNSTSTKIQISPLTFSLTANAGDTLSEVIKVRNDSAQSLQVSVQALNFTAVGEEGDVALTPETGNFALASWIHFDNNTFMMKPGEEQQVPFLIRVPVGAEPGGHYASVFAYVGPPQAAGQSGSFIGQRIGSLILLRVAGDVHESAVIDTFKASQSNPYSPVTFETRVKNTGSVHVRPQGFVSITDIFGKKVADVKVDDRNVLPDAIRKLDAVWSKHPFIGKFQANVLLQYGQSNQQISATTSFWIIPWRELAIGTGIVIVVLLVLWFGRRRIGKSLAALVGK